MSNLNTLASDIIANLAIAQFKPENPPTAAEKRAAAFEIGHALKKARAEFDGDREFGRWVCSHIIEKCVGTFPQQTFHRYRMLAEFTDSLALAEKCGFTNIYKMMEDNDRAKEAKAWVMENHETMKPVDLKRKIKELLTGEVTLSPEQIAKVEAAKWKRKYEEQQQAINEGAAISDKTIEFAKFILGIEVELDRAVISKAYKRNAILFHPDKGGTDAQIRMIIEARDTLLSVI